MPIKDKSLYPPDWKQRSLKAIADGGNVCAHCGVKNGAIGARDRFGTWHDEHEIDGMKSDIGFALFEEYPKIIRIVLTVNHKVSIARGGSHEPENLEPLCQKCHFAADRAENLEKAAETRRRKKAMKEMFDEAVASL